ncbi:MAG: adenylate kinase [Clostridia bacterium]
MRLILLGAPGAGKGTQAETICRRLNIPTISTGNILREAVKAGTALGREAKGFMDEGKLVPDNVIVAMVKERLALDDCKNGFILDGMPRTVAQAKALDAMGIAIDTVLSLEVSDSDVERRMTGRRVCESCGASYHLLYKPAKQDGTCDSCNGKLIQRRDDAPETVRDRLAVYHEQTEPLKEYYSAQAKLKLVKGQEQVSDTTKLVFDTLGI